MTKVQHAAGLGCTFGAPSRWYSSAHQRSWTSSPTSSPPLMCPSRDREFSPAAGSLGRGGPAGATVERLGAASIWAETTYPPGVAGVLSWLGQTPIPAVAIAPQTAPGWRRCDCEDSFAALMVMGCGLVTAGVTHVVTGFVPCCDLSARGCWPRPGGVSPWRWRSSSTVRAVGGAPLRDQRLH